MSLKKLLPIFLIFCICLSVFSTAYATNTENNQKYIYISNNGNDDNDGLTAFTSKKTIQNGIKNANNGDIIVIKSGTYKENIEINKNITIIGENTKTTIINGEKTDTCIKITPRTIATIQGLTITQGTSNENGGGIQNEGTTTIKTCIITKNTAKTGDGGGIDNSEGNMTITNSQINENTAGFNGGGIYNGGTLKIDNSQIENNNALDGGGIANEKLLIINNSKIIKNTAKRQCGGIYIHGNEVLINNSTILENSAKYNGGGIYNYFGTLTVTNSIIMNNKAKIGGGLYNENTIYNLPKTFFDQKSIDQTTGNKPENFTGKPIELLTKP